MITAITPEFVHKLEYGMRVVQEQSYADRERTTWWRSVAKEMPSMSRRERLIWMLDTARIEYVDRGGGSVTFENLLSKTFEYENKAATGGLRLNRADLEDLDSGGIDQAAEWSRQIGQEAAYWPQRVVAAAVNAGHLTTSPFGLAYDGGAFFSTAHPVNPFDASAGTYRNVFTSSASGVYPGAVPISGVSLETAVENLGKVAAYLASIPQPNGDSPRGIRMRGLIVPPALAARAQQITNAQFIAMDSAGSGGGSADGIKAMVSNWNLGTPIQADELGSAFGGADTTYYVVADAGAADINALVYSQREPFQIVWNTGMTDSELARANELQWVIRGRNTVAYGHPYKLFKCMAT